MQKLVDGMLLYHGSYVIVDSPDLTKCADRTCISQLIPERLKDQYCFRTNKSFESISFVESEQIWIE